MRTKEGIAYDGGLVQFCHDNGDLGPSPSSRDGSPPWGMNEPAAPPDT